MRKTIVLFFYCMIFAAFALSYAGGADLSMNYLRDALKYDRAVEEDLHIPVSRELPLTTPLIEESLNSPLPSAEKISGRIESLRGAGSPATEFRSCLELLSMKPVESAAAQQPGVTLPAGLPPELAAIVSRLYGAVIQAREAASKSASSLPSGQRDLIKRMIFEELDPDYKADIDYDLMNKDGEEISYTQWKAELYKSIEPFDQAGVCKAAAELISACDAALPELEKFRAGAAPGRVKSADGAILVSGPGDDVYNDADIAGVELLIDLGGNNTYYCSPAAAGEGQARVVIDFGENVIIETSSPAAGSGIFGIGLAYFPNPAGAKKIISGNFSQGCGIFGTGGLFVNGRAQMNGGVFCQGSGAFGAGVLSQRTGDGSSFSAKYFSQGAGFTRGAGLFYVRGSSLSVKGGLEIPDFREPLGFTSLCQGVGFGPRALAGGGIGMAILETTGSRAESSYFAQGAGYWHSLGVFILDGQGNETQARRYCQGAGVHSAYGMMMLNGERNRTINWGVGPAFGWDFSVGVFISSGNANVFRCDWGCGQGANGGHALFSASGDDNIIALPRLGSGSYTRDSAGYGAAVVNGKNVILKKDKDRFFLPVEPGAAGALSAGTGGVKGGTKGDGGDAGSGTTFISKFDPWGVLKTRGVTLKEKIELPEPVWPKPGAPRGRDTREETVKSLFRVYDVYLRKSDVESILAVSSADAGVMIRLYQPYSVEEILALRTVFSAYGSAVFPIIKEEIEQSSGTKRAVLLALMNFQRSGDAAPFLIGLLKDSELRVRASALRSLAYLFNSDDSNEPGRQTLLEGCVELLEKNKKQSPKLKEKWTRILTNRQMTDAFCLLALSDKFTVEERLRLYKLSPNLFENVTPEFKTAFGEFLLANRGAYLEAFRKELAAMKALQPGVEQACAALLGDSEARVKVQATAALGEMRAENYFDRLTVLLDDGNMQVKEAAGAALAHFGIRTYRFYDEKFDSAPEEARALMITSASQAREEPLPKIIIRGLKDKSNLVRATAVSAILNLRPNLEKRKKKLISGLHAKDGYLR